MIKRLILYVYRKSAYYINRKWLHLGEKPIFGIGCVIHNEQYISIGDRMRIGRNSFLSCYDTCRGGDTIPHLNIGNDFAARENLKILCADYISIGNNVTLAGNILITDENHGDNPETDNYLENPLSVSPVYIEDGVWIGENAIILPGCRIGKKSIIGAGSVVTKSIPAYCIAVGNPCKVIKRWENGQWRRV